MIVADAGGLLALGSVGVVEFLVDEFDVRTTEAVIASVEASGTRHGPEGTGSRAVLAILDGIEVVDPAGQPILTSRLDSTAGGAVALARELDAPFFLTDDVRAVHEIRQLAPGAVVTPPVALLALVRRGALSQLDARFRLDALHERRRGLEAVVTDRSRALFEAART